MFGEEREYLTIKILHNDMTVMVPSENAALAGLRRVIDEALQSRMAPAEIEAIFGEEWVRAIGSDDAARGSWKA